MALDELPPERDPWKDGGRSELDEWIRKMKDVLWRGFKMKSSKPASSNRPQWKRSLPWAIALLLGVWLISGLASLPPGQVALLYAFGYPVREVHSGYFWNWPAPLGRVIRQDPVKPHSRYVVFHSLTKRGLPVLVTIHYRYQRSHPRTAILFAPHPGLWLRGLLMVAVTRWTEDHDRVVRSPRYPERLPTEPPVVRLRKRFNHALQTEHVGLVLVHLGISVAPARAARAAWKEWKKRDTSGKADARTLKQKLDGALVQEKRQGQHREGRAEIQIQRWIGQAKILVARFDVLLPVYRQHPTLVRQTLMHALYDQPSHPVSFGTTRTGSEPGARGKRIPGRGARSLHGHSGRGVS